MSASPTIVLLTGANSGISYAATKVLASASSAYHIIMAGRSRQKVTDAAAEIKAGGIKGSLSTLVLDVTDEDSIAAAAEEIKQQFGRVDVLINNAGIVSTNTNLKKEYEETLVANTIGPVLVTEAFKALLLNSKQPRILHVSSGLGSLDRAADATDGAYHAEWTPYRMSKAALDMYVIQNDKQLGKQGVKVFGVCPGLVRSNLRGTSEEQVSAGGRAIDPEVSGVLMLDIIEGRRDADVGKLVQKDGIWKW